MKRYLSAVAFTAVLAAVPIFTGGICEEQSDVFCGHRCESNSCVKDAQAQPDTACWLDYTTSPVSCDDEDNAAECSSSCEL